MATEPEPPCGDAARRLTEAFLAHREPEPADRAHAAGCRECGALRAELRALASALDAERPPELAAESAARVRARVARELARELPAARPAALPPGFRRELLRILAWAAAPLPLLALWYALLFERGAVLLASFLPPPAVTAVGFAFAAATLSWLAVIYGSLPFVAHHRARRRWREVTT